MASKAKHYKEQYLTPEPNKKSPTKPAKKRRDKDAKNEELMGNH